MRAGTGLPGQGGLTEEMRDQILAAPEAILEDAELMRALVDANEVAMGDNVVDLRGAAMRRLEGRLDRLEDTHRSVIAAAYENLAGTNIVHRAVLQLLDPVDFEGFVGLLAGPVAATLRVQSLRLVLESHDPAMPGPHARLGTVLGIVAPGFVESHLALGRGGLSRGVLLREVAGGDPLLHGDAAPRIRSEAALRLDLGPGRLPALLVLGSEDPGQYRPTQGTDLLTFFGAAFERVMRRWLS